MFGKKTIKTLGNAELADIDREEFILVRNMEHDRHRLAYLRARRKQLRLPEPIVKELYGPGNKLLVVKP